MRGEGLFADLTAQRFAMAVKRLGLKTKLPPLRTDLFAPSLGDAAQPSLFD